MTEPTTPELPQSSQPTIPASNTGVAIVNGVLIDNIAVDAVDALEAARMGLIGLTVEAPKPDRVKCSNDGCGAILCERNRDGALILTYWERHIPRPHTLTADDLPRDWRCNACGTVTHLDASIL